MIDLDDTVEDVSAITVEIINPETPFGGVQVFGASDDPIQIVLREGEQGPPGPPGPSGPTSDLPAGGVFVNDKGLTQLVIGQSYIDVVFNFAQADNTWFFVECSVVNTADPTPLNIWAGIITSKTTSGFRLQLNGMPDSNNYFLDWAISGVNVAPTPAITFILSGPSSGGVGVPSTFTVHLPTSTSGTATITPSDGGAGGAFSPISVTITTGAPSATFTYTPSTAGAKTISVTNDGGLLNPANLSFLAINYATGYSLSGPSSGGVGVASTNFTVALPGSTTVTGTVTVTPSDGGGGGTFTPTTVNLTTAAPSATFTYTPGSVGAKTISATNDGGLTNPGSLTYTASILPLSDGDPVTTWIDSSGSGHTATQSGSARPIYKTNIINSKPVVRFSAASSTILNLASSISGDDPWTVFVVMKPTVAGSSLVSLGCGGTNMPMSFTEHSDANAYSGSKSAYHNAASGSWTGAFHVFSASPASGVWLVDGATQIPAGHANVVSADFTNIGAPTSDGDIAEIIFYNVNFLLADAQNISKYLGAKYGITVSTGTSADPTSLTGLVGWWKADTL